MPDQGWTRWLGPSHRWLGGFRGVFILTSVELEAGQVEKSESVLAIVIDGAGVGEESELDVAGTLCTFFCHREVDDSHLVVQSGVLVRICGW